MSGTISTAVDIGNSFYLIVINKSKIMSLTIVLHDIFLGSVFVTFLSVKHVAGIKVTSVQTRSSNMQSTAASPPAPPPPPNPQTSYQIQQTYQPSTAESGGHIVGQPKSTILALCLNVTHNLTQLCLGGVIFSAIAVANINTLSESLAQHIILCTIGYAILMTQAILAFSPFGWANNLKFGNKRIFHLVLQVLGSTLAVAGTIIRLIDREFTLSSAHAICGFVAMVLAISTLFGGILSLIFPQQMNTKIMKILHSCAGVLTLTVAFVTLIFGFDYLYRELFGDANATLSIVLTVLALVGTILMGMVKNVKRLLNK